MKVTDPSVVLQIQAALILGLDGKVPENFHADGVWGPLCQIAWQWWRLQCGLSAGNGDLDPEGLLPLVARYELFEKFGEVKEVVQKLFATDA